MRKIKFIALIALLLTPFLNYGQSTDRTKIDVKAEAVNNIVYLRWATKDVSVWEQSKTKGFTIVRFTLANQTSPLTKTEIDRSRVTLSTVYPQNRAQLLQNFGSSHKLAIVADSMYYDSSYTKMKINPKFADAVEYNRKKEAKNMFLMLIAEQDYNIAKALALAYTDNTVQQGFKYSYSILQSNTNIDLVAGGYTEVTVSNVSLATPTDLIITSGDKIAKLQWKIPAGADQYSFYNIYRSSNGSTFQKVNTDPYININGSGKDENIAFFTDSLPSNGASYFYYVKGLTAFGQEGPPSPTFSVIGRSDKMPLAVEITTITPLNGQLKVDWRLVSQDINFTNYTSNIAKFNIYKKVKITDAFTTVATNRPSTERSYTFPLSSDHYIVIVMVDISGHQYTSIHHLAQFVDSIPPVKPIGLKAKMLTPNKIAMEWAANTEQDLLGYKVFFAYRKEGPFTQLTVDHIVENKYINILKENNVNERIYYTVLALDKRYNSSLMSDAIMVGLPDNEGPNAPVITQVLPRPEGIRIGWKQSSSKDLKIQRLQRKVKSATTWTNITGNIKPGEYLSLPITSSETAPSNYIDGSPLELREYQYRLFVEDNVGNQNMSNIYTVKPFDDGLRGTIPAFTAELIPEGTTVIAPGGSVYTDSNQLKVRGKAAKLTWTYNTLFTSSLLEFRVYVKNIYAPGTLSPGTPDYDAPVLIKTVKAKDAKATAVANSWSGYAAFLEDIKVDQFSNDKEYTILAYHTDGGFSPKVVTVMIVP